MENSKNKAMLLAVLECSPSILKCLLDLEVDVNCVLDESGNTALHLAALETARLACAQVLIKGGADLDVKNAIGQTPLHVACGRGNACFVQMLVSEQATFNIDSKDGNGRTGLMICSMNKNESILDNLIEAGANVNEVETFHGITALQHAISVSYPCSDGLRKLITKSDVNLKNNLGMTAFQLAIQLRQENHAFLLIEKSPQVNVYETDDFGNTIFHVVMHRGRTDYLEKIIGNTRDLVHHKNNRSVTPLHYAARAQYQEGVELILMNDIKQTPGDGPIKALFVSIIQRDEPSLNTILSNGGDIDHVDSCGRGPLHWAVMARFITGVDLLLSKGADVNQQDKFGISALHLAALIDNEGIVTKLLAKGAEVNMKDEDGRAPLHFASLSFRTFSLSGNPAFMCFNVPPYSNTSAIVILLRAGCLLDLQDRDGNTPLNLALECEDAFAIHALLIWGAKTDIANKSGSSLCHSPSVFSDRIYIQGILYYHIAKLKQANLKMYNGNSFGELDSILLHVQDFLEPILKQQQLLLLQQCKIEWEEIIILKIGRFYLRDVFTMEKHSFLFDRELESSLFSTSAEEKFPLYGHMLQAQFMKSEMRHRRINEAVQLQLIAETKSGDKAHLPEEVKRVIFSLLPDEDLVSVIKAVSGSAIQVISKS